MVEHRSVSGARWLVALAASLLVLAIAFSI
jgi:hypothetical protein